MYAISLTSIPPRLPRIAPVLQSLLAQRPAPLAVYLCLPGEWSRFPGESPVISPPKGVEVLRSEEDFGPATKAIVAARHLSGQGARLIYCDDDWFYPQGWAQALLSNSLEQQAAAASGFDVARLKRVSAGKAEDTDVEIAQGFGGVSIAPEWLDVTDIAPPPHAQGADDIWLSGQLARQGISIRLCPSARDGLKPAFTDEHGLQDINQMGQTRRDANTAALSELTARYGIWPPISAQD